MTQRDENDCGGHDSPVPSQVGRQVRRAQVVVEVVYVGEWRDIENVLICAIDECMPNAAVSSDLIEDVTLGYSGGRVAAR